jgi:hypothetical protein
VKWGKEVDFCIMILPQASRKGTEVKRGTRSGIIFQEERFYFGGGLLAFFPGTD